jgi:hypothetical protein
VLRLPDGRAQRLKVRSMVGLLPLCAVTVFEGEMIKRHPELADHLRRFLAARPELTANMHDRARRGCVDRLLASILNESKLRRVLARMLEENEFFSPCVIRALSRCHAEHPYVFHVGEREYRVSYLPAESDSGMFGGNSNWRGPIWMPVNALIIRALLQYYAYYGDDFKVECPTGSGRQMTLYQVAEALSRRLTSIFLRDDSVAYHVVASRATYWRQTTRMPTPYTKATISNSASTELRKRTTDAMAASYRAIALSGTRFRSRNCRTSGRMRRCTTSSATINKGSATR